MGLSVPLREQETARWPDVEYTPVIPRLRSRKTRTAYATQKVQGQPELQSKTISPEAELEHRVCMLAM